MNDSIEVIRGKNGWEVHGPFCSFMRANSMGEITYCNLNPDSAHYKKMEKALRSYTSDSSSPNGEG